MRSQICMSVFVYLFRKRWYSENGGVETPFSSPQRINTHHLHSKSWRGTIARPSEWAEYKIEK